MVPNARSTFLLIRNGLSDQEPLIPAVDSVFIIIVAGFSASFWVEFDWKRDRNWLSAWLTLLVGVPVEPLLALELPSASADAAWA